MTKSALAEFVFRSIQFTADGEPCIGFINHDAGLDAFSIVYTAVENGAEHRRSIPLSDELTARITFNPEKDILTLA